jgi:hypothetical protein
VIDFGGAGASGTSNPPRQLRHSLHGTCFRSAQPKNVRSRVESPDPHRFWLSLNVMNIARCVLPESLVPFGEDPSTGSQEFGSPSSELIPGPCQPGRFTEWRTAPRSTRTRAAQTLMMHPGYRLRRRRVRSASPERGCRPPETKVSATACERTSPNLGREPAVCTIGFELDADFAHLFEVKENRVRNHGQGVIEVRVPFCPLSTGRADQPRPRGTFPGALRSPRRHSSTI